MTKYPSPKEARMTNPESKRPADDCQSRARMRHAAVPLWQEAKELHLIFAKIYRG